MPDFQFKVVNIAAKGDFVAAELVGAGTSTGPTERYYYDRMALLQQLNS